MKTIKNENDRANLIQRLNKLNGSEKALWGKMNVNQMVSHLVQAGEMPFGHTLEDKGNFISKNIVKPLVLYILPIWESGDELTGKRVERVEFDL